MAANARELLSSWRDGAAIVFLAALATLFVRNSLSGLAPNIELATILAASSGLAISCDLSLRSRTRFFREESAIAAAALTGNASLHYRLVAHALASSAASLLFCAPNRALSLQFVASWWFSLLPVALLAALLSSARAKGLFRRTGWLGPLWRSRRYGSGALTVAALLALTNFVLPWLIDDNAAAILAGGLSLLALSWFSPVDHSIVNFERLMGHEPTSSVRAVLREPARIGVAALIGAAASLSPRSAAMVAVVATVVLLYRYLTIMLSRIVSPRQVQFTMLVVLAITISAVFALPYAAPVPIVLLIAWLNRNAARRTWLAE